ncbi:MAG: hypothetical protein JRH20_03545 [Deltaproteobacteria bacterium]|nr:hypothetical protein [Deltaproteobacteria bacterium]
MLKIQGHPAKATTAAPRRAGNTSKRFSLHPSSAPKAEKAPEKPTISEQIVHSLADLEKQRQAIDKALASAQRGRTFDAVELISLQAKVYRYAHEMEIYSRVVDRATTAAKTVLSQQG